MSVQAPVPTSVVKYDKPNHDSEDSIKGFNNISEYLLRPFVLPHWGH